MKEGVALSPKPTKKSESNNRNENGNENNRNYQPITFMTGPIWRNPNTYIVVVSLLNELNTSQKITDQIKRLKGKSYYG
jgi:hypothetical protein